MKKKVLVLLRDDNSGVSIYPSVIETDEELSELSKHAHIVEVIKEVSADTPIGRTVIQIPKEPETVVQEVEKPKAKPIRK